MEREEKVLKLMNKTGACRQDVENALNACQDDILDAAMYLEALGKVNPMAGMASSENSSAYSNSANMQGNNTTYNQGGNKNKGTSFAAGIGKVLGTIGGWIKKGLENYLDIYKDGNCVFSIPITVLVLLFIPFFWLMLVLLVVFLFMGCRYEFRGPDCKKDGTANQALNKAAGTCHSVKEDFMRGYNGGANNSDDSGNNNM